MGSKKRSQFSGFFQAWQTYIGGPSFANKENNKMSQMGGPTGQLESTTQAVPQEAITKQPLMDWQRKVPTVTPDTVLVEAKKWDNGISASKFKFSVPVPAHVAYQKLIPVEKSPAYKQHGSAAKALLSSKRDATNPIAQSNLLGFEASLEFARTRTFMESKPTYKPQFENANPIDVLELEKYIMDYHAAHVPGIKSHNPLGVKPHRVFPKKLEGETEEQRARRALPAW